MRGWSGENLQGGEVTSCWWWLVELCCAEAGWVVVAVVVFVFLRAAVATQAPQLKAKPQ